VTASLPVLVIEHELECPPAWLGEWLTDAGLSMRVYRPYSGDRLPDSLDGFSALLVLGGAMGANDDADFPWLTDTKKLLRASVDQQVPTLGVCLGLQLACVALGGTVAENASGRQRGLLDIGWTPAAHADPLFASVSDGAFAVHWNNDIAVDLPPGCQVVAQTPAGIPQVLRFGPAAWGLQFHPEVGSELFGLWAETDREASAAIGVDVDAVAEAIERAEQELRATWRQMMVGFAGVVVAA
jgi:GMP synthase (glutamine-hydrolysing)